MKHIHRFFVGQKLAIGQPALLENDDAFHAARVLRMKKGDRVELAGAGGAVFDASVGAVAAAGGSYEVRLVPENRIAGELPPRRAPLTVAQAMPAGRKMDLIVEKLSELGVDRLAPLLTEKSVARGGKPAAGRDRPNEKQSRWRRIARSAAAQAKRSAVMDIGEPISLAVWLETDDGRPLVLATEKEGMPLGEAVQEALAGTPVGGAAGPLALVIGPEAGFSPEEIDTMSRHGAIFASLGPLVLRTETAAVAAAAVVLHRLGVLG